MKAYFGFINNNKKDKKFIYIPNNLFGIEEDYGKYNFDYDPDTLQGLALLISKKVITRKNLEKQGWIIHGINLSDEIIKDFRDLCFKRTNERKKHRRQIRKMVYEITELAFEIGAYEYYCRRYPPEHLYDDGYFGMDTEEELDEDEWWKRDKQPPFLRDDIDWDKEDNLD